MSAVYANGRGAGTLDAAESTVWQRAADRRSPVHSPQWYSAAGWSARAELLTAGSSAVAVWRVRPGEHGFHDPVTLFDLHHPALRRGSLVTISPFGYRGGALAPGGAAESELAELAEALLDRARESGASLVLSHYLFAEDDRPWLHALIRAGGMPIVLGADCVLDVRWNDLGQYYRWLGTSRRAQLAEARALESTNLLWHSHSAAGAPPHRAHLVRLLHAHAARFERRDPPPRSLFAAMVDGSALPRTLLTVGPPDDAPRSVLVALHSGQDSLHAKSFGTDAPRTDYFPLVYPALVRHAIRHGVRRVDYGGGSHQAKLLRGARLRLGFGVLFVLDDELAEVLPQAASRVSDHKLGYFSELARRFQHASLSADGGMALLESEEV